VKLYLEDVTYTNNNLKLFELEGMPSKIDKVTCYTPNTIKDLTFSFDANTGKTSAQYTQGLPDGSFAIYEAPNVDENGNTQRAFQYVNSTTGVSSSSSLGLSVADTLEIMKSFNIESPTTVIGKTQY